MKNSAQTQASRNAEWMCKQMQKGPWPLDRVHLRVCGQAWSAFLRCSTAYQDVEELLDKEGQGEPGRLFWRAHKVIFLVHFKSVTDLGRGESRGKSGHFLHRNES